MVLRFITLDSSVGVEELQSHSEDHKGRHAEMADHVQRLKQEKDWL